MGTLVKNKFEKATVSFGLESNVVDPTTSARVFEKQLAVNVAKQVKAQKWYFETLNASCSGKDMGTAYQYWVLAELPAEEFDRVQAWKAKKEAAKSAEKAADRERIKQEIEQIISSHKKALSEVDVLMNTYGDPVSAMSVLQGDWNTVYDMMKTLEGRIGVFSSEISQSPYI